MKIKNKSNDKAIINTNIVMTILMVVVLSFVSVGYAYYNQNLGINGRVTVKPQGKIAITNVAFLSGENVLTQGNIAITNVVLKSSKNVPDDVNPTFTDNSIDFDLVFQKEEGSTSNTYQAVYNITITNDTFYDFTFNDINYQPVVYNSANEEVDPSLLTHTITGINEGDKILANDEVTFTITFNFTPTDDDTYTVDNEMNLDMQENPHGRLLGSIPSDVTLDLRESLNNNIDSFTLTVVNSYQSSRTFTINSSDSNHFKITNASGGNYGSVSIAGGETQTYTVYVKRVDDAVFGSDTFNNSIYLSYSDNNHVDCGSVRILVDEDIIVDETPPVISNVSVVINSATSENMSDNNVGSVTVNWDGSDPESGVKKYYVVVNNNTYETTNNTSSLTITGLQDGTYVFKVYGENNDGYKASSTDISNATTSQGYCSASSSSNYDWHFTVTQTGQYMQNLTNTSVNRGYNYSTTLRAQANSGNYTYTLPNNITVRMGGNTISTGNTSGHYTYSNSSGALTVYGVTGDIAITANATRSGGGCGG